jgi:SAM-dependent methyltransferase
MSSNLSSKRMRGAWGKIFIATRYQPNNPWQFTESLAGLIQHGMRAGDQRDYVPSKTMHKAANMLVRNFLVSDCDSLCFIDSDAVFGSNALEELRSDADGQAYDVLQAFTVKRGWPPEPMFMVEATAQPQGERAMRGVHYATQLPLNPEYVYPGEGDGYRIAVSLHFTLVRRWVFEQMLADMGRPAEYTYWFEYARDNGEDINFSITANALGARLGMTTKLKVGHVSEIVSGWGTMVDYYHRKFEVEAGAPPADLQGALRTQQAELQLSELYSEYSGLPLAQVFNRVSTAVVNVADAWQQADPQTPEQVRAFYGDTEDYVYDLIRWNCRPAYQRLLGELARSLALHEVILEVGGGLGTTAEFLAARGHRVDYYDVPGVLLDFASWRFARAQRLGLANAPHVIKRWPTGAYDRVVAIDVLEHIHPEELRPFLNGLHMALKPGGLLFAHNEFDKHGDAYPQHFESGPIWEQFLQELDYSAVGECLWRKPLLGEAQAIDLDDPELRAAMVVDVEAA